MRISCEKNEDCQTTFAEVNMACVDFRCVCVMGYRIWQDPLDYQIKCAKATSGAQLKYPKACEFPACELQYHLFVFEDALTQQRHVSISLITDHHFYSNESIQVLFNDNKLKFFVDNNDKLRVVLGDRFNALCKTLYATANVRADGGFKNVVRARRDASSNQNVSTMKRDRDRAEAILVRRPRCGELLVNP